MGALFKRTHLSFQRVQEVGEDLSQGDCIAAGMFWLSKQSWVMGPVLAGECSENPIAILFG